MKVNGCSREQLDPSGDWPVVELCLAGSSGMICAKDSEWEDVGRYCCGWALCVRRCLVHANFVCGKPFTCSFDFTVEHTVYGKGLSEMFWVCVCLSEVPSTIQPNKWAGLLFKPISLHPCSGMRIVNFGWLQRSWLSLISVICCAEN